MTMFITFLILLIGIVGWCMLIMGMIDEMHRHYKFVRRQREFRNATVRNRSSK